MIATPVDGKITRIGIGSGATAVVAGTVSASGAVVAGTASGSGAVVAGTASGSGAVVAGTTSGSGAVVAATASAPSSSSPQPTNVVKATAAIATVRTRLLKVLLIITFR